MASLVLWLVSKKNEKIGAFDEQGNLRARQCDQQQARVGEECHQGRAWQHEEKLGLRDAVCEQGRAWQHGHGRELHGGVGECDQDWSCGVCHQEDRPRIRAFRVNKGSKEGPDEQQDKRSKGKGGALQRGRDAMSSSLVKSFATLNITSNVTVNLSDQRRQDEASGRGRGGDHRRVHREGSKKDDVGRVRSTGESRQGIAEKGGSGYGDVQSGKAAEKGASQEGRYGDSLEPWRPGPVLGSTKRSRQMDSVISTRWVACSFPWKPWKSEAISSPTSELSGSW